MEANIEKKNTKERPASDQRSIQKLTNAKIFKYLWVYCGSKETWKKKIRLIATKY